MNNKKENKKNDPSIFAVAFISELGIPRMIVGEKKNKETIKQFIDNRALQKIKTTPANKFDAVSNYIPLIGAEIVVEDVVGKGEKETKPTKIGDKGYQSSVKEGDLAKYLKDHGWVCYQKKSKKNNA